MTIESNGTPQRHEHDITILFLSDEEACNGETGERMVTETQKLAYCPDSIVEAYLSAYCETIGRWVMVYERLDRFFSGNDGTLPPFFTNLEKLDLMTFWRATTSSFIAAISLSKSRGVIHGGPFCRTCYVISSGTVKIMNVGRAQHSRDYVEDLYHLRSFIWSNPVFGVTNSADWAGFDNLLGSRKMQQK
uniref:Uncharacterized protein n=1 Tax=Setaria viridis TaxID=4556 RepID=A0A4U6VAK9_SETVI|nr:hypothetical protein SEVIR_4G193900v2 [Setaria viridis]